MLPKVELPPPSCIPKVPNLRDQFAMAALTGMIATNTTTTMLNVVAECAYEYADAMLLAREGAR